jgi:hypothetical protein
MEDVGIFYGHLVYFTDIRYILWPLVTFSGSLVYLFPFWYVVARKIWQPCSQIDVKNNLIAIIFFQ